MEAVRSLHAGATFQHINARHLRSMWKKKTAPLNPREDTVFRTRKFQYRKLVERFEADDG